MSTDILGQALKKFHWPLQLASYFWTTESWSGNWKVFQLESTQTPFQFAIYTAYQCTPIKVIVQLQHTKVCTIQASVHAWCMCFNFLLSDLCLPGSLYFIITTTISCDMWNRIHNFLWGYITCTCYLETRAKCVP